MNDNFSNLIPEDLRSDYLFLIVGTNPLPSWVAAQVLLRPGGQIYLIHSDDKSDKKKGTTHSVASRLAMFLVEKKFKQPVYIPIRNESSPAEVYQAVRKVVQGLPLGQVGLNYTGGTKVMAVHAYQAVRDFGSSMFTEPVFSYLDARRLRMVFDPAEGTLASREYEIGLVENCKIKLQDLIRLHGDYLHKKPEENVLAKPLIDELVSLHRTPNGFKSWKAWLNSMRPAPKPKDKNAEDKPEEGASPIDPSLAGVMKILFGEDIQPGPTQMKSLSHRLGFEEPKEFTLFLEGGWLEHYTLESVCQVAASAHVHDYGRNLQMIEGRKFEADVFAVRGYQLFLISCYSSEKRSVAKQKLFEAFLRARQLGGDEARAALVCCYSDAKDIENEVLETWDVQDRVRVFGLNELPDLPKHLQDWFSGK